MYEIRLTRISYTSLSFHTTHFEPNVLLLNFGVITPFVGEQVNICRAFGFQIPDGCSPVYVSKSKPVVKKRGRSAKPKVEKLTF